MKSTGTLLNCRFSLVASFAEAWIEIAFKSALGVTLLVASFAEAWIEIPAFDVTLKIFPSPPSRRRGLKLCRLKSWL